MRLMAAILILFLVAGAGYGKEKKAEKSSPAAGPAAGEKAPGFSLPAFPGGKVRLKDFEGRWLALMFYPKARAPKDTAQMASVRDAWPQIKGLNAAVLGVSMDPPGVIAEFQKEQRLPFALACDADKGASTAYHALGLGGLFSSRRVIFIDPQGRVAGILDKCPEKQYGPRIVETLKALQKRGS
ncbi:MAG: redoxin domain-containing protein [Kiritimatiellia bacterium]